MRMTHSLVQVAIALMDDPLGSHWGYDLSRRARVRSGVLYPMLTRFMEADWVSDGWEPADEVSGRPRRRYYTLTDLGRRELGAIVLEAQRDGRFVAHFGAA